MALQASIKKITPPGSIINGPPTPPRTDSKPSTRVATILQALKTFQNGTLPRAPWTVFKLSSEEYEELLVQLKHDELLGEFVADKVQYDYDPIQSKFILRMPTTLHDTFISKLVKEIEKQLQDLADTEVVTQPFIERIEPLSGELKFPVDDDEQERDVDDKSDVEGFMEKEKAVDKGKKKHKRKYKKHEPDIRFQHKDAAWPGVVIEVANSQKRKSLVDLADNYILGSHGGILIMVGIDLDYKKSKRASISTWRPHISTGGDRGPEREVVQEVDDQPFRDAEGNPILSPSSGLKLSLRDFAIEEVSHAVPDSPLVIDSETLCKLLGEAENWDEKTRTQQGAKPQPLKRKWRPRSPPEELRFSDEEDVKEEERRVRKKWKKQEQDKTYGEEGGSAEPSSRGSI